MSGHNFEMRLSCTYNDSKNNVDTLAVEILLGSEWQEMEVGNNTAGFLVFVYSVFSCQHMHFRLGAAAHDLVLASSKGHIIMSTDDQWDINLLQVDFKGILHSGDATQETIEAISQRMNSCPVSRNLKAIADNNTVVTFE